MLAENSVYSEHVDDYFQKLLSLAYELYEDNIVLFCGDYNACVGSKRDFVAQINIDTMHNDHDKSLIDFLLQANMSIIYGRVTPLQDSFTLISHIGKAVLDYFLIPHDNVADVEEFEVITKSNRARFCKSLGSQYYKL